MVLPVMTQILSACPLLEDLTLWNCNSTLGGGYSSLLPHAVAHPLLGAATQMMTAAAGSATRSPSLRSLQLRFDASLRAYLNDCVLSELAAIPMITVHADSVVLCVPLPSAPVPAAVTIVTHRLGLTGCASFAELSADLASFRSRCQLTVEGTCLDTALAKWAPPPFRHGQRDSKRALMEDLGYEIKYVDKDSSDDEDE